VSEGVGVRPCLGSVAQPRIFVREAGVRYHGRTTNRGFKSNCEVSAAFVTTRANS